MTRKAKRRSGKSQNPWGCSKGCDVSTKICEHIEKELPQIRDGDMPQLISSEAAARSTISFHDTVNWRFDLEEFKAQMRSFGILDTWDMNLLEARYYYGMTLRQIEKEQNFTSYETIRRRLNQLHALLEERGYKRVKK